MKERDERGIESLFKFEKWMKKFLERKKLPSIFLDPLQSLGISPRNINSFRSCSLLERVNLIWYEGEKDVVWDLSFFLDDYYFNDLLRALISFNSFDLSYSTEFINDLSILLRLLSYVTCLINNCHIPLFWFTYSKLKK